MRGSEALDRALRAFLDEDLGPGDVTANALVPADTLAQARLIAKEAGRICGLDVARRVFALLDPPASFTAHVSDGAEVLEGQRVATLDGTARTLLAGERVALNLLQRMSGIATETARYVAAAAGTGAQIFDTRKTAPGLRALDKAAVVAGGGCNHRHGLYDQVLIKENHLAALAADLGSPEGERPLEQAVQRARAEAPGLVVEIEVWTVEEAVRAARAGADVVLLDNFDLDHVREAVAATRELAVALEASGGVTLETVGDLAQTGVDRISVGALTHSVRGLDLSLLFDRAPLPDP